MARSYRMTPARRAALRKAQQASARKRRGKGKGKSAKRPGHILKETGNFVHRGRTKPRKIARGVGVAAAAHYTPFGVVLAGSTARYMIHNRKASSSARKQASRSRKARRARKKK